MSRDIQIAVKNDNEIKTNDLLFEINSKGKVDLYLNKTNKDFVEQKVLIELKFFQGEWFLDINKGVPYHQSIFVKGVSQGEVDSIFKNAILNSEGIQSILKYESERIVATREYLVSFTAKTIDDEIIDYTVRL